MSDQGKIDPKLKNVYVILFVFAATLVLFCFRWQVVNSSSLVEIAKGRVYSSEIDSIRGAIYAKDGSTLAYTEPRFDMYLWMDDMLFFEKQGMQSREEFLGKVAPIINLTKEQLEEKITNYYERNNIKWIPIAKSLTDTQWKELIEIKTDADANRLLGGYTFVHTSERKYPEGRLAAHIVGLTNEYNGELKGVSGLEERWNGTLSPTKGFLIKENDAFGQAIATALFPTVEPKNGSAIYTSIDKKLQKIIEAQIKDGVQKYQATSGTIVVMDPKTGQIMALANYPDFNPNVREEKDPDVYGNIAVTEPYEIGSVGKTFTISAAIDLGVITPDTIIMPNGHQGCEEIHKDLLPVCTADKMPQPPMPASECFRKSDNLCFYHIAEKMNRSDFYQYLYNYGIGRATGVDVIRAESIGELKSFEDWNIGDVSAFSYGHGYMVNAVQAVDAVGTVANGGIRMKPYVVTKVVDSDGNEKVYDPIVMGRVISDETFKKMVEMMHNNFQSSIGIYENWYDDLRNYKICMKSGTGLIVENGEYVNEINGTYIGFDCSEDRTFIMLVRLEKPEIPSYDKLAFYNTRFVWLDTFAAIKDYLNVPRM